MDRQRDFDGKVAPVSGVKYPFVSPTTGELTEAELQPTEDGQMQHEDGSYIIRTAMGEVIPASLEELQANVNEARKAKVRAKYAELQKQDEAETDNRQAEAETSEMMPLEVAVEEVFSGEYSDKRKGNSEFLRCSLGRIIFFCCYLTLIFCPAFMRVPFMPFNRASFLTVVPFLRAIAPSVSPFLTV